MSSHNALLFIQIHSTSRSDLCHCVLKKWMWVKNCEVFSLVALSFGLGFQKRECFYHVKVMNKIERRQCYYTIHSNLKSEICLWGISISHYKRWGHSFHASTCMAIHGHMKDHWRAQSLIHVHMTYERSSRNTSIEIDHQENTLRK